MLYTQIDRIINQMKGAPSSLPDRWTTPEGVTITRFGKLSDASLQTFDWVPVIYEEITDGFVHNLTPTFDEINQRFIYEAISQNIDILITDSENRIDEAASFASAKYISQGVGQECRYMLKREQAISFLLNPTPVMSDYPMLKREADETGVTPKEVAQMVSYTAELWLIIAAEIEALRCGGKKKCREAAGVTEVIQFRDAAVSALGFI